MKVSVQLYIKIPKSDQILELLRQTLCHVSLNCLFKSNATKVLVNLSEEQTKWIFQDNLGVFFYISP